MATTAGVASAGRQSTVEVARRGSLAGGKMGALPDIDIRPSLPAGLGPSERVHCSAVVRSTVERLILVNALPVDIAKRVRPSEIRASAVAAYD